MPNTDKPFEWTEANVIDFAYSVRHNDNFKDGIALSKGTIYELAKEFKRGKERKILFVTEDNVVIYEGDGFWGVDKNFELNKNMTFHNFKYFSTKEAANEYVILHKPVFSANDIIEWYNSRACLPTFIKDEIIELAKQKING